jgi:hypothetical protein
VLDVLAYIDPGSGSLIIQAVIAAVVAIPFFFRTQIARVGRAIRPRSRDTDAVARPTDRSSEQPR